MEVSGHFKVFVIPSEQEAGWSPASVWTFMRVKQFVLVELVLILDKPLATAGNRAPDFSAYCLVIVATMLSWLK